MRSIVFCLFSFFKKKTKPHTLLSFLTLLYVAYSPGIAVAQERTTTYTFTEYNHILDVSDTSAENIDYINVSGTDNGITTAGTNNWTININATQTQGVVSDAGHAITSNTHDNAGRNEEINSGTINLNSGIIKSTSGNAINLAGSITDLARTNSSTQTINIAENSSVLSTHNKAINYIDYHKTGTGGLFITNDGTIQSDLSQAILFSSRNDMSLTNNGIIKGSEAILTTNSLSDSQSTTQITNTGLIDGNIHLNTTGQIINSGTIQGSIASTYNENYKLTIVNNSSNGNYESRIEGSIDLEKHEDSSLTLNGGSIIGEIKIKKQGQQINFNGGSYQGRITASNANSNEIGTVNINGDFILESSSEFGWKDTINNRILDTINIKNGANLTAYGSAHTNNLNIDSQSKLTLQSNNIIATNTLVEGTLDFGDTNRTFTGNIAGSGTGTIDIGSGAHNVNGNLHVTSGDTIAVTLSADGAVGSITSSGMANVESGAKLAVGLGGPYEYIEDGSQYKIVSGQEGSDINAVEDENINANESGSNKAFRVLTFSSRAEGNDLYLHVARSQAQELTHNKKYQRIYNILNEIGGNATGELESFQEHIDNSSSAAEFEAALQSATPQGDGGTQRNSVTTVNNSIRTTERRLDSIRIADARSAAPATKQNVRISIPRNLTPKTKYKFSISANGNHHNYKLPNSKPIKTSFKIVKGTSSGISSGDDSINKGIWGQTFGSVGKQNSSSEDGGFSSQSSGVAFGYDQKISKNSRLGFAVSYANSRVKSTNALKRTTVDTYQANIYHGKNFGKYFFDSMVGFAWNEYNSNRAINSIAKNAQAKYAGQSYISKIRTGFIKNIGSGFNLIPQISLNYVHNRNSRYAENGAGTMNLEVQGSSSNFLEGRVGLKLGYFAKTKEGGQIIPELRASYGYDFIGDRQTITSNFAGQTATFTSLAAKVDPRSFRAGMGVEFININQITLSADYNYEKKTEYYSHSGSLKARYDF